MDSLFDYDIDSDESSEQGIISNVAGHCGKQVSNALMALRIIVDSIYV